MSKNLVKDIVKGRTYEISYTFTATMDLAEVDFGDEDDGITKFSFKEVGVPFVPGDILRSKKTGEVVLIKNESSGVLLAGPRDDREGFPLWNSGSVGDTVALVLPAINESFTHYWEKVVL